MRLRTIGLIATFVLALLAAPLPTEAVKFNLVVNMKTARQLGITIPPSILYQANKVIR